MKLTFKVMILISILAVMGAYVTVTALKTSAGIDFYQFWGVSHAQKFSNGGLSSPYQEMANYEALLDWYSAGSDDLRLKAANLANHQLYSVGLDLIGTPLIFALYGFFSKNYSHAYVVFQTIQSILFGTAIVVLFLHRKVKCRYFIALSLLIPCYSPLVSNIRVGNINSFQLFLIVAYILFFDRVVKRSSGRMVYLYGVICISFLVLLTMVKPNMIIVTMLLSASLLSAHGLKVYISSLVTGLFSGLALICVSCLYFNSWLVWSDWYHYLSDNKSKLFYPVHNGNYSTVCIAFEQFGLNKNTSIIIVVLCIFLHGLYVLLRDKNVEVTYFEYLKNTSVELLKDPFLTVSLGITITLAISPLVWWHYYIISLVPALWLIIVSKKWNDIGLLGMLSIILTSGYIPIVFGWHNFEPYPVAFGWIPLWLGITTVVKNRTREVLC
jgi:Glycosyltransferase family 87